MRTYKGKIENIITENIENINTRYYYKVSYDLNKSDLNIKIRNSNTKSGLSDSSWDKVSDNDEIFIKTLNSFYKVKNVKNVKIYYYNINIKYYKEKFNIIFKNKASIENNDLSVEQFTELINLCRETVKQYRELKLGLISASLSVKYNDFYDKILLEMY